MSEIVAALGLALAIEGALYALFPGPARRAMASVAALSDGGFRVYGLAAALVGLLLVWLVRGA